MNARPARGIPLLVAKRDKKVGRLCFWIAKGLEKRWARICNFYEPRHSYRDVALADGRKNLQCWEDGKAHRGYEESCRLLLHVVAIVLAAILAAKPMRNSILYALCWLIGCWVAASDVAAAMRPGHYFDAGPQRELAEAAENGRTDAIDRILNGGASIDFRGKEGMTALIWAILHQNKKGYEHLLKRGASPNLAMTISTLTKDGLTDGNSAMSFAAMHEDPWYLEATLKHGGDPNVMNPVKEVTPIFQCIMFLDHSRPRPRLDQLKMLIVAGANLDARNRSDITPVMYAVRVNRYDMAYMMLEAGADPRAKTRSGTTVLYEIRESRIDPKSQLFPWRAKVIELLKLKGIDVENGK